MKTNDSTNQNSTKDVKDAPNDYYKDKEIQKEVFTSTDSTEDESPRKNGFIGV